MSVIRYLQLSGFLLFLCCIQKVSWPSSFQEFCLFLPGGALELQTFTLRSQLFMRSGDLNSGLHAHTASAFAHWTTFPVLKILAWTKTWFKNISGKSWKENLHSGPQTGTFLDSFNLETELNFQCLPTQIESFCFIGGEYGKYRKNPKATAGGIGCFQESARWKESSSSLD